MGMQWFGVEGEDGPRCGVVVRVPENEAFALRGDYHVAALRGLFDVGGFRVSRGSAPLFVCAPYTASPPSIACMTQAAPKTQQKQQEQHSVRARRQLVNNTQTEESRRQEQAVLKLCQDALDLRLGQDGFDNNGCGFVAVFITTPSRIALALRQSMIYANVYKGLTDEMVTRVQAEPLALEADQHQLAQAAKLQDGDAHVSDITFRDQSGLGASCLLPGNRVAEHGTVIPNKIKFVSRSSISSTLSFASLSSPLPPPLTPKQPPLFHS